MAHKVTHEANLVALRRIGGQIQGVQRMIESKKYCIDIVNQLQASINALHGVAEKILTKHMEHCVAEALRGKSEQLRTAKVGELMSTIRRLRKL